MSLNFLKGEFMQVLKSGSTGSLVQLLQLALIRAGFLSGEPDGIFGKKTEDAVKSFQNAFFLTPDGIAGEKTFSELERYITGYYIKTVNKGDTLWSIAAFSGAGLDALITANPEIDPDRIFPGDKITVPFIFPLVPTDIEYSSYLVRLLLRGLVARYPFIKLSSMGKSVMGKELWYIKCGNGDKQLFVNAGFHANEWLNIPVVLKFLEEYLKAVSRKRLFEKENVRELFNNTCLILCPLVNPDGLDIVTGALQQGEFYEKAKNIASKFSDVPFPDGWKANINGVDLNLQFPANWEAAKKIKSEEGFTSPSPIEFVGPFPLSEPEAVAIADFTKEYDFKMMLAYHSQGSIIYWKYLDYLPPESERTGALLSKASGYPLELTPLSSSYAGYKDWFIQEYNKPGYTIETGKGVNPLPITQIDTIYNENKKLLITALKETMLL